MYRIKKYKKGWIVEYKNPICFLFFVFYKWKHITHYSGMNDKPYYYKTPEKAREGALREVKDQINFSFDFS